MGGRSLGDMQDQIIGGYHHGGALALKENPERAKEVFSFVTKIEFLDTYYLEEKP